MENPVRLALRAAGYELTSYGGRRLCGSAVIEVAWISGDLSAARWQFGAYKAKPIPSQHLAPEWLFAEYVSATASFALLAADVDIEKLAEYEAKLLRILDALEAP
jgi:hypothetical protein